MFAGIVYALMACFIWGLIFVVPEWMESYTAIEVAIGRYIVYGTVSALFFLKILLNKHIHFSREVWLKALYFSLASTFGYYTCLVLGLRYASPAICALVIGISPITIAFYGNWRQKETAFKNLIIPSILILIGLVIINVPHIETTDSPGEYALGLVFAVISLLCWSWYVVANARFMRYHPQIDPNQWSTLIGVATLLWVFVFTIILILFFEDQFHMEKYITPNEALTNFWVGSLVLGLLCSWMGAFLWNKASLYLPVSLAGQLTVFETIFGVIFVYMVTKSVPSTLEVVGILILLTGVIVGIRHFSKKKVKQLEPH
jgi:drug/metabolite transporter (DMT)-like permease